ncbi:RraA family protein [Granulosicoccus sp. 3-233]|uniref:RraA family protein n=1 Tax=Granulosicoccus sp. 3-233 TaxID=3417969 RepID=UPI003D3321D5
MIEEPPLLIIRENHARPSARQLQALAGTPTGFLADAMKGRGALPAGIRHVSPGILPARMCGPALTCLCGPADVLAVFAGLGEVQPGDIMVASTGQWDGSAVIGDRVMGMLRNAGGQGFVTDGLVRDVAGINKVGLPVMCAGVSPNSPYANGPGEVGTDVQLGDMRISSGDVIVSDEDGAVVIAHDRLDDVITALETVRELEASLDAAVDNGLIMPDSTRELLSSSRVRRI